MKKQDDGIAELDSGAIEASLPSTAWQTGVGVAVMSCALMWAIGVLTMPAETQWLGGGARLVPSMCALVLLVCGGWLVWEARNGGWRNASTLSGYVGLQVTPWVWVSAGILLGGGLIGVLGFIVAGAVCYVMALQGLRLAADVCYRASGKQWAADLVCGLFLASLIFLIFTYVVGIGLPAKGGLWM